jgi:hypothetical protein
VLDVVVAGAGLVPGEERRERLRRLGEVDDADDEEGCPGKDGGGDEEPVVFHGHTLGALPVLFLTAI